jgi:gentisate 1,2-dioxygenase
MAASPLFETLATQARGLDDLYPILRDRRFTAGWHKKTPSLWPEPKTAFQPRNWKYAEARRLIDLAGQWISTELAERRNLLMYDPVQDNEYASLPTLVAAYQMLKPAEHARAHRHTPNALRLVLDSEDEVYTVVDGVQLAMRPGDVLLTPGWTWHSHFNHGGANAYWIDFLDVPLVHRLESMFFEPHPDHFQKVAATPAHSVLRISIDDQTRLLEAASEEQGHRQALLETPSLSTIALTVHQLEKGASTLKQQLAANQIWAVIEGAGNAEIGNVRIEWQAGDVFTVPIWHPFRIHAAESARLLEVSDAPVHKALGFYRDRQLWK